jgi:hypothetical protein
MESGSNLSQSLDSVNTVPGEEEVSLASIKTMFFKARAGLMSISSCCRKQFIQLQLKKKGSSWKA